jgi:hypothetical protein
MKMADSDGKVTIWEKKSGKAVRVFTVDAREMLQQDFYSAFCPTTGEIDEKIAPPAHGPPDLEDWTVRELEAHMVERFNEKRNVTKYPRKSDIVRRIEKLYALEEQQMKSQEKLESMDEIVVEEEAEIED